MPGKHITPDERVIISTLIKENRSHAYIAQRIACDRTTIWREIKRNTTARGYDKNRAQAKYEQRREACQPSRKLECLTMRRYVVDKLVDGWTPEEIAGRLPLEYPDDPTMRICHETIYQSIYRDKRLHFLIEYLPQSRRKRRKRGQGKFKRGPSIKDQINISQRPAIIEERTRFGDLEGDLIVGAGQSGYIITNVCRTSRLLIAHKSETKEAKPIADSMIESLLDLPQSWVRTITLDNGTEFAQHQKIAKELNADVYFCDPYSSWQRGTNENTNGLIRRYLPKGTSFKKLTQKQLDHIVEQINNRPRKCLSYQTPNEIFQKQRHEHLVALSA